jgi:hypothetical protein
MKKLLLNVFLFLGIFLGNNSWAQESGSFTFQVGDTWNMSPCNVTVTGTVTIDYITDGDQDSHQATASGSLTISFSGDDCPINGHSFDVVFSVNQNDEIIGSNPQSQRDLSIYPELVEVIREVLKEYRM